MNAYPYVVTTAANAQMLRDYASTKQNDPKVAIFPENGRSAAEQATYLSTKDDSISEIITFSPFIISDAAPGCLNVLDLSESQHNIHYGDSVNRVTLRLWRKSTIGACAEAYIESVRAKVSNTSNVEHLETLAEQMDHVGDSVEKHILMNSIYKKIDQLKAEAQNQEPATPE